MRGFALLIIVGAIGCGASTPPQASKSGPGVNTTPAVPPKPRTADAAWSLESPRVSFRPYNIYVEHQSGRAMVDTFAINPKEEEPLVLMTCRIEALTAEADAVAKLAARRKEVQAQITDTSSPVLRLSKNRVALSTDAQQRLTGTYRMFEMGFVSLVDAAGKKYTPIWTIHPNGKGSDNVTLYLIDRGVFYGSEFGHDPDFWHQTVRGDHCFAGLLEVNHAVPLYLIFRLPKALKLEELKAGIGTAPPLAIEVEAKPPSSDDLVEYRGR